MTKGQPGVTEYSTPSDTELQVVRVVRASAAAAYRAYTEPQYLQRWLLGPPGWTMPVCEMDARAGGSWKYVWRKATGEEMGMEGKVLDAVPGVRVVTTERWGPAWPETTNTVTFSERDGLTVITLVIRYPSWDAREAALKTGMKSGVEASYARLDDVLSRSD